MYVKINTLSFQLIGSKMALSGMIRTKIIADLAGEYEPDLLVCAGWSIDSIANLKDLEIATNRLENTTILIEVQHDSDLALNGHRLKHLYKKESSPEHVMYAVNKGVSKRLGEQFFATSKELDYVRGQRGLDAKEKITALEEDIMHRKFVAGGKKVIALCCGELNILKGRDNVNCRSAIIASHLESTNIIINPTHDLMGNGGTLKAKRKYMSNSKGMQNKLSISVSNWNSNKKRSDGKFIMQNPIAPTLHTVYRDGAALEPIDVIRGKDRYEMRMFDVSKL